MHNTTEISSDATLLLGLEGLAVTAVERGDDGHCVAHVVTDDEAARACRRGTFDAGQAARGHLTA
ncbi:hypothetical protein [Microtetraspora sp. NBRC 16547]|uniref:hypothetical protein n=1 Tax=Microtetraspora sp. NBRC 16547 TaxID=3030993 RepID=UPI0024A52B3D|nr:hypothetical protein [Microtetraspora sp. NBRC 16547]GLX03033.1 hypothetical protein Misp02_71190 [Microtetraspora sp. NBRC 16547]